MKKLTSALLGVLIFSGAALTAQDDQAAANAALAEIRENIAQWIQIRADISEELLEHQRDVDLVRNNIELFETQIEEMEASITSMREDVQGGAAARQELNQAREALVQAAAAVEARIPVYEERLAELVQFFPDPLRERLSTLIQQLESENRGSIGARLATVVTILNEAYRFNAGITVREERRQVGSSDATAGVDVIYIGLAQAFWVDAEGLNAAVGTPARGGWTWTPNNEVAPALREVIDMYTGRVNTPAFVPIPFQVTDAN